MGYCCDSRAHRAWRIFRSGLDQYLGPQVPGYYLTILLKDCSIKQPITVPQLDPKSRPFRHVSRSHTSNQTPPNLSKHAHYSIFLVFINVCGLICITHDQLELKQCQQQSLSVLSPQNLPRNCEQEHKGLSHSLSVD